MTKIHIMSGFLGAGKTTLIKKLLEEVFRGQQVALIENEFGEISIDGALLGDSGILVKEVNSGCICCSLVGDFRASLRQLMEQYAPDRILIEPSGVGRLSDVIRAVEEAGLEDAVLSSRTAVVDAVKCARYLKSFGAFYGDQIRHADAILLSRTAGRTEAELETLTALLRQENAGAALVTTPWEELSGEQLLAAMEGGGSLQAELDQLSREAEHHHEHEHHHRGDCCGHEHHHHDHPHAEEVFAAWGTETARVYRAEELEAILGRLSGGEYGEVLRAKGLVRAESGWLHLDYVPGEERVAPGPAGVTGRLCVIGAGLKEEALRQLFLGE